MIYKKFGCLAAIAVIGAALTAVPAQARFGGVGGIGGMHSAGFAAPRVGSFGGIGGGFAARSAFVGRPAFVNRGFFPGHRFAFFPRHRFIAPFFGFGAIAAAYPSCWTWVPTAFGWRRVWACGDDVGWY